MPIDIPKDKWPGSIKPVTIGATTSEGGSRTKSITVGGQATLPFMQFEATTPNPPVVAVEIKSRKPEDWSPLLEEAWGEAIADPAAAALTGRRRFMMLPIRWGQPISTIR